MGKGDIKSKRGKIRAGSFGNSRPANKKATVAAPAAAAEKKASTKKKK